MADEEEEDWFESALREQADSSASDDTDDETVDDGEDDRGDDEEDNVFAGDDSEGTDDGALFDDDFADALGGGGGGEFGGGDFADLDDEGFGGPEMGGDFDSEDFDEELDSEIDRIDLGIGGLDEMIQGGVPERSLIVSIGGAGTGKTTFGLQFIEHGLQQGENGVFITLEEGYDRIVTSAEEKGWAFQEAIDDGNLAVIDIDPIEMANSLQSIRSELPQLVEEFDADRLVLDSVSLLEMMYDDQARRRTEIYDFTKSLKVSGVTTMLTSEASEASPFASRHGIIEYLTDAVIVLRYVRPEDFRETRLAVEIQKIRDANHSRETKPYEITDEGISVYRQANIF
ncbi:MAG: KaiC domain-containing protein [Halobacteriaceae archaeon]